MTVRAVRFSALYAPTRALLLRNHRYHNLLRITSVLCASMLCGIIEEARIFLDAISMAAADRPDTVGRSEEFWKTAVTTIPTSPEAD